MDDTPKRRPGRPVTTGTSPVRTIRVGQVWEQAAAIAAARGESLPDVVRRSLERYVARHRRELGR